MHVPWQQRQHSGKGQPVAVEKSLPLARRSGPGSMTRAAHARHLPDPSDCTRTGGGRGTALTAPASGICTAPAGWVCVIGDGARVAVTCLPCGSVALRSLTWPRRLSLPVGWTAAESMAGTAPSGRLTGEDEKLYKWPSAAGADAAHGPSSHRPDRKGRSRAGRAAGGGGGGGVAGPIFELCLRMLPRTSRRTARVAGGKLLAGLHQSGLVLLHRARRGVHRACLTCGGGEAGRDGDQH
eukprot:CAMPEP_0175796260 /NCGR_PEP_ID=MMETSP0097-20121207/84882_1 /TAXON_ID=311494 /ORGANISM="Alexandrium monilatum, Strain CCMP3105" /LENGTH=238 /DNA_ID=CAMNT_0017107457 /DNA_START=104 /DNA_END=818 /DNA_ORIENTATION=+